MSDASTGPTLTQADLDKARTEGHAAGQKEGAAAERARISAILGGVAANGRETLANFYAFETDDSAEKANAALAKASPASPAAAVPSIEARAAETATLRRVDGHTDATTPKQAGAVTIDVLAEAINAEQARAAGRR